MRVNGPSSLYLQKPFETSAVATKVNQSLERRHNGLTIKNLIQQIKDLPPQGEDGKEERLLFLSKNLCEVLGEGALSHPAGIEESLKVHSNPAQPYPNVH